MPVTTQWTAFLVPILFALTLAAIGCGGGGGDGAPTPGGGFELQYTGNTDPAPVTTTNATSLIANLIGFVDPDESMPGLQSQAAREGSERLVFSYTFL